MRRFSIIKVSALLQLNYKCDEQLPIKDTVWFAKFVNPELCIGGILICSIKFYRYCYLEKAVAPHSSTLAWKIPWTEKPDRASMESMGSQRVRHD